VYVLSRVAAEHVLHCAVVHAMRNAVVGLCVSVILLFFSTGAGADEEKELVEFRLVEGLPRKTEPYTHTSNPVRPTPSREPQPIIANTPVDFLPLNGKCFEERIGKYLYEICPFRNVTQLDKQASWNPFYGILGIYSGWTTDTAFDAQLYTDGTACGGNVKRQITVTFRCAEKYRIFNVEEPKTCVYKLEFDLPEVCNMTTNTTADELPDENVMLEMTVDGEPTVSASAGAMPTEDTVVEIAEGPTRTSEEEGEKIMFNEADENKDGSLSVQEFQDWASKHKILRLQSTLSIRSEEAERM